jgi:hypothetical protein
VINIPKPEAVLNDLIPVLTSSYEAFEFGTFKAREYFEKEKSKMDSYLAAHLARFNAMKKLREKGCDVDDNENHPHYSLKTLSNSGIFLAYDRYRVRMLKSKNGDLPHPGYSQSRHRYYNQDYWQMTIDFPNCAEMAEECINLVLLWNTDSDYSLKSFSLAFPKAAGSTKDSVLVYWNTMIPMEYLQNIIVVPPSLSPVEIKDLPIKLDMEIEIEREILK